MTRPRNPFQEFERLIERMQANVGEAGRWWESDSVARANDETAIRVDLEDGDGELVLTADLPGFEVDDIDLRVTGRRLRLAAEREEASEDADGEYVRRERHRASVTRSIPLPVAVETDDVSATYENGLLTVRLPKTEPRTEGTRVEVT